MAVVRPRDPSGGGVTRLVRVPALQASWVAGKVVLWAGNALATPANREDLRRLVAEAGGSAVNWKKHKGAPLPTGGRAPAVAAPPSEALGWLVGVGAGQLALDAGPSVRWLGEVAAWATDLVAQGRMVPTLRRGGSAIVRGRQRTGTYVVRWIAAVVDRERIRELSARMPGPVRAFVPAAGAERLCRSVLDAAAEAICRAGVARLVTAAAPSVARSRRDVTEAVLAGLAGDAFAAAHGPATEVAHDLRRWTSPVVDDGDVGLIVRLAPPEADGGWVLTVDATGLERQPLPVERAVTASGAKAQRVETQLRRLERLVPALRRTGHRGNVVLGVDEAWDLMAGPGGCSNAPVSTCGCLPPRGPNRRPGYDSRPRDRSAPPRWGPTSSPGSAGRCCSTTSSSTPPPSPGSPPRPGPWSAPGAAGSSSTAPTSRPPPGR